MSKLVLNREFFREYFQSSSSFKVCLFESENSYSFDDYLNLILNPECCNYEKGEKMGRDFINRYKISEDKLGDIVAMFIIILDGINKDKPDKEFIERHIKRKSLSRIIEKLELILKGNGEKLDRIVFHFKKQPLLKKQPAISLEESLELDLLIPDLHKLLLTLKDMPYSERSGFTDDLKTFSWAILNYLNKFTDYKAGKGILATNEQCRIIYEMLYSLDMLNHRPAEDIDKETYIREYLKQAAANS